jgi:anti-sigma B factor antagonist
MEIERRENGNVVILDMNGKLDLHSVSEVMDLISKLVEEQKYNVIINLDRVFFVDSSGLGALISSVSTLRKYRGDLKIIKVSKSIRNVFELTKLTSIFEIYDSEMDAVSAFK